MGEGRVRGTKETVICRAVLTQLPQFDEKNNVFWVFGCFVSLHFLLDYFRKEFETEFFQQDLLVVRGLRSELSRGCYRPVISGSISWRQGILVGEVTELRRLQIALNLSTERVRQHQRPEHRNVRFQRGQRGL